MKIATAKPIGSLTPIRQLLVELDDVAEKGGQLHPEGDGAIHATNVIRARLRQAIEEAEREEIALDVHQLAEIEGVSPDAIYKRRQRGKLSAEKRGGRLRFRVAQEN